MAETVTRSLPAPFIEAAGKTYLDELTKTVGGIKGIDLSKTIWSNNLLLDQEHYKLKQKDCLLV
jgi:hypothetical protein